MADRFEVDATGLARLAARYRNAGPVVEAELRGAMGRALLAVQRAAMKNAPVDTGTLRRSLTTEVRPLGTSLRGAVGTNVPYARAVEEGAPPGRWVPEGELRGWMRRKGIDASLEFVIRRAIHRRGTRAQPFLRPAFVGLQPRIRREFALVPRRVLARLNGRAG